MFPFASAVPAHTHVLSDPLTRLCSALPLNLPHPLAPSLSLSLLLGVFCLSIFRSWLHFWPIVCCHLQALSLSLSLALLSFAFPFTFLAVFLVFPSQFPFAATAARTCLAAPRALLSFHTRSLHLASTLAYALALLWIVKLLRTQTHTHTESTAQALLNSPPTLDRFRFRCV